MLGPVRYALWLLARVVLSWRYRLRVTGLEEAARRPGPFLVLPNHPGSADPPNVLRALWGRLRVRPVLLETYFTSPALAPLAWVLRAIKVPDTDRPSAHAHRRAEAAVRAAADALAAGENVVLWPAGTLSRDGTERVGATRAAAEVLRAVPHATVLLVRTRGLWGSSLSWARGRKPALMDRLAAGAGWLLLNLLAFGPRRPVHVHVEAFGPGERPEATREALNPWLEAWYAADGGEPPTFVPYHPFLGPRVYQFPPPVGTTEAAPERVSPAAREAVAYALAERLKRDLTPDEDRAETELSSLGLDSLEAAEVALEVERRFGVTGATVPETVGGLWALAEGLAGGGSAAPPPPAWFAPPSDPGPYAILGETIPEAFVNRALLHPRDVAAADDRSGVLTYERLLVGALTLARRFRDLPGDAVGLLLPASVAADVAFLGLHLAGKLPVALNWTTGPAALGHAVRLTGLTRVVTSRAFVDRTRLAVPGAEFVFVEDVRGSAGRAELLGRLLAVRYLGGAVRRRALGRLPADPHRPAVVLFTSGSETAPKAVPLTHANVIADQRAAVPPQRLTRADSVLGFLPMFHSFGLTLASLFPVLAGGRVVHHPDPTDAAALARKLGAYRPTVLIGTPTFVGLILARCGPGDLDSLRLVVVGAERCPDGVFARVAELAPRATVLEGYGVTECGPCVSVNPVDAVRRGTVGRPLPGVDVCVADSDTGAVLPPGETGMLLVSGPTVFPGYLGNGAESPFREVGGRRWYVTGDLAALDPDGYVVFRGRLKRFLKAGGEMVSLPALEEPFARLYPAGEDGPRAAVEGVETPGGRHVVLFTTEDVTLRAANAVLLGAGFRGVMRLDEVRRVGRIPVLGTGKTDYKALRARLESAAATPAVPVS